MGRNKAVFICRQYDCLHWISQGSHKNEINKQKTPRTNKWVQETHYWHWKVTRHKINTHAKNQLHVYILTMNKWTPKFKMQYHWILIAQMKIKYLGFNWIKHIRICITKIIKCWRQHWRDIPCSWMRRLNNSPYIIL